jgi:general secretion pathway protein K
MAGRLGRNQQAPEGARDGQEGIALMIVLLFIVLLSAIVVEYAYEMQVEASLAANTTNDLQAYIAAKSAVAAGMGLLQADLMESSILDAAQNVKQAATALANIKKTGQIGQTAQGGQEEYDSLTDVWAQGVPYQILNDAIMQCSISDEYGKLNLNALVNSEGQVNEALENALRTLFANLGLEKDPTDAILDWLDPDDDVRPEGAESDTYSGLETPYSCKNGPMDSLDELLLIADIPPEFFFDALVYIRGESMDQKDDTEGPVPLSDLLTVHGEPSGAVNVNTARPEVLDALMGATGDTNGAAIEDILQMRLEEPFKSVQDFYSRAGVHAPQQQGKTKTPAGKNSSTNQSAAKAASTTTSSGNSNNASTTASGNNSGTTSGATTQSQGPFTVRSDIFRIYGDGQMGDVMVRVEAYVFRLSNEARAASGSQMTTSATPTNKAKPKNATKSSSKKQDSTDAGMESFRILDWRVIR